MLGLVAVVAPLLGCKSDAPSRAVPAPVSVAGERLHVAVDPRVELLSIVFRLAGNEEYRRAQGPYAAAVDAHFASHARHEAVRLAATLRQQFGISFEAPVQLALHLDASWRPAMPLDPLPKELVARWKGAPVAPFAAALADFASSTRFDDFWRARAGYFGAVCAKLRPVLSEQVILGWFDAVFGPRPRTRYLVVPGLLTGPMNYGVRAELPGGRSVDAQILAIENPDGEALPRPTAQTLALQHRPRTWRRITTESQRGEARRRQSSR